jgi:hypothetical protein
MEDSFISFFPDCREGESREQLPYALENRVVEGDNIPINKGFPNAAAVSLGAPHGLCSPVPNLLTVMTSVEEVFHGFLTL